MNLTRFYLNILSVNPIDQYKITKAKQAYIKTHPECAICGATKGLEVHHVLPQHLYPDLACDFNNFITLHDGITNNGCHYFFGHFGDFKNKWNLNIRQYALASRLFLNKMEPKRIFIIKTEYLIKEFAEALKISEHILLEQVTNFNK
jgi:hypothetical protein